MTIWVIALALMSSNIDDVKEGDCLTLTEVQQLTGVSDGSLFDADSCESEYPLKGELTESLACGLELYAGQWSRSVLRHKKPGFFWPRPVPCQASVTQLQKEIHFHDLIMVDSEACLEEDSFISVYQTETLQTKMYKAGQGELYFSSPLFVHREEFGYDAALGISLSSCKQTELTGRYIGMSEIQIRFEERVCPTGEKVQCKLLMVSPKTNADGKSCAYIENIHFCP